MVKLYHFAAGKWRLVDLIVPRKANTYLAPGYLVTLV